MNAHADEDGDLIIDFGRLNVSPSFREKIDKYLPLSDCFVDLIRFKKIWSVSADRKVKCVAESDELLFQVLNDALQS